MSQEDTAIHLTEQRSSSSQPIIDQIGSYAKTAYPAYTLSTLFALSAPFGFAGGRDLERVKNATITPRSQAVVGQVIGKQISNSLKKSPSSLPPFWQLAGFAIAFGGGGYIIDQGDILNGAGTVTAWSGIYLFFNAISSIRRPRPLSLILTTSTLAIGATIHGCYYFNKTSWKGAVPGLHHPKSTSSYNTGSKSS